MTTSITLRATKGSALTHAEMDANLTNLQTTADQALAASDTLTANKAEAAALGVNNTDLNMGSFTGTTISDNVSAKAALQALETAVETKATAAALGVTASAASMGTYTGSTISDNQTAKQNLQEIETAVEARPTSATLAATGGAALVGSNDDASGSLWTTIAGFITYLRSSVGSSILGFIQAGTGPVARTAQAKMRERVSAVDFNVVGNGVTSDTTAIGNLNSASVTGLRLINADAILTGTALTLTGKGETVQGNGRIKGSGSNESLTVGGDDTFVAIAAAMAEGASEVTLSSVSGYSVGQRVLMIGGLSTNSSGGNDIPKWKQWFTIREVDTGNVKLKFTAKSSYTFTPGTGTADQYGKISSASAPVAQRKTIQGMHLTNDSAFSGPYGHSTKLVNAISIRDSLFDFYSATGFTAYSDHVVYDNVEFVGYSGISCARGTKKAVWRDCTYKPRYSSPEGFSAFLEETPEDVLVDNFTAWGGQFRVTSSADNDVRKNVLVRDLKLDYDGTMAGTANIFPAIQAVFDTTADGQCLFDGGMITTPGGSEGGAHPKCAAYISSSGRVKLKNLLFAGLDSDSYAIAVNDSNTFNVEIENCRIIDGSGLGLCHSSVLTNLGSTVINVKDLEVAVSAVVSGGTAVGKKYVTYDPNAGICRVRYQFDNIPNGTYNILSATKTNGVHLYEVAVHTSGSGRSTAYKATVAQDFNTAPVVVQDGALGAAAITIALSGTTTSTFSITWAAGTTTDNMVVEVLYYLTKADPAVTLTWL